MSNQKIQKKKSLCQIERQYLGSWFSWNGIIVFEDKKGRTILNAFIEIVNEYNCKPNKLCIDQGR